MTDIPAGTPRYFASWTGYAVPVRPHNPIPYERAEASRGFMSFVFDADDRAVTFDSWLATARRRDVSALAGRALPRGRVFFAPDPGDRGLPGRVVTLAETQGVAAYFRARVHPDGEVDSLELVLRERTIHHEYDYWSNGRIRTFRFDAGGEHGTDEYDRDGRVVRSTTETDA